MEGQGLPSAEEVGKLCTLTASGHQSGGPLDETLCGFMLNDELVLKLEKALSITYSLVVSEFMHDDSTYLSKHCPPHAATQP